MDYTSPADAQRMKGLRLALTAGLPAPWSEGAKAMFRVKGIPFTPVLQQAGEANVELVAWTGHRNAPTAIYDNDSPRVTVMQILALAERLAPEPSLLPADMEERIRMVGLLDELAGENGLAWNGRLIMFAGLVDTYGEAAMAGNPMFAEYCYSPEAAAAATGRVIEVLDALTGQLQGQQAIGSHFFVGDTLTALDLYWAPFSQMLEVLPRERNPMPDAVHQWWSQVPKKISEAGYVVSPLLMAHRNHMFDEYFPNPLDF
jgi:glutathione S-transferase